MRLWLIVASNFIAESQLEVPWRYMILCIIEVFRFWSKMRWYCGRSGMLNLKEFFEMTTIRKWKWYSNDSNAFQSLKIMLLFFSFSHVQSMHFFKVAFAFEWNSKETKMNKNACSHITNLTKRSRSFSNSFWFRSIPMLVTFFYWAVDTIQ